MVHCSESHLLGGRGTSLMLWWAIDARAILTSSMEQEQLPICQWFDTNFTELEIEAAAVVIMH